MAPVEESALVYEPESNTPSEPNTPMAGSQTLAFTTTKEPQQSSSSTPSDGKTPAESRRSSSSGSGSESPVWFLEEGGPTFNLTLLDLLVSFEASVDLISRRVKRTAKDVREKTETSVRRVRKKKDRNQQGQEGGLEKEKVGGIGGGTIKASGKRSGEWRDWTDKFDFDLDALNDKADREIAKLRLKIRDRVGKLSTTWSDTKVVSFREKLSFFFAVNQLIFTTLLLGFAPEYIHINFTILALYFLPLRWITYKKAKWHYFLFDLCYYTNALCLFFIWVTPDNAFILEAAYGLSHGPLGTAILTWRNSLVFHSFDKVTSLFIHIYPPLTMFVIRHIYPNRAERFPSVTKLPSFSTVHFLTLNTLLYIVWQACYWQFIIRARRHKIEKEGRVTSFTFMLNDKKGLIGRTLQHIPPRYREAVFMFGQLLYTILTVWPAIYFYQSKWMNGCFLIGIFGIAVWNGATYYLEVFGKRFEKELTALRREFDALSKELPHSIKRDLVETGKAERLEINQEGQQQKKKQADGDGGTVVSSETKTSTTISSTSKDGGKKKDDITGGDGNVTGAASSSTTSGEDLEETASTNGEESEWTGAEALSTDTSRDDEETEEEDEEDEKGNEDENENLKTPKVNG